MVADAHDRDLVAQRKEDVMLLRMHFYATLYLSCGMEYSVKRLDWRVAGGEREFDSHR